MMDDDEFLEPKERAPQRPTHKNAKRPVEPEKTYREKLGEFEDDDLWEMLKERLSLEDDERQIHYGTRKKLLDALCITADSEDADAEFELGSPGVGDFLSADNIAQLDESEAAKKRNAKKIKERMEQAELNASIQQTGSGVSQEDIAAAMKDLSGATDEEEEDEPS